MDEELTSAGEPASHEKLLFDRVRDLNEVEHVLLGSSSPDRLNFGLLNMQLEEGILDPQVLAPSGITFPISEEEAQQLQDRREDQEELVGTSFGFLDMRDQYEIAKRGFAIRFQPIGHISRIKGTADPIWRISIINPSTNEGEDNEVNDPELDQYLNRVSEFYEGKLAVSPTLKTGSRFLHPVGLKQKT